METYSLADLRKVVMSLNTQEDLEEVGALLRERWSQLMGEEVLRFQPGDRVRWFHGESWHAGTVQRRNSKTLTVSEDGTRVMWRISPSGLVAEAHTARL